MIAAVEIGSRVEIVVVRRQSGGSEAVGLRLIQHAERAAGFQPQPAHHAHHREHLVERRTVGHVAPRRAHAEARRSLLTGARRGLGELIEADEIRSRDVRPVVG